MHQTSRRKAGGIGVLDESFENYNLVSLFFNFCADFPNRPRCCYCQNQVQTHRTI